MNGDILEIIIAKQLYEELTKTGIYVSFDRFLEILDIAIKKDDMVKALEECINKINMITPCTFIISMYIGYMLSECMLSKKCTIKILKNK